ncbi:molecular chaperone HtpG [Flammeovirgaceae bacterium SG7u.111]|nr:molecular chaperone HtpG [Flammeovirgaceae bacterium SG7u.132]WPO34709.1 molecular chaperone HtpG [Flammeovirgaceae bacterium SG7u.111]
MEERGTISVNTENIFPIIKKFLYSDQEIFLRELVSNAVDATQKLQKLASIGEFKEELGEIKVKVSIDKENKKITISDSGIGMTAEEIKKYINQIAFSGATEFVEKFKDVKDANQIIGKFGLGFYSAFMVADTVEIITKSYKEGSEAARWSCTGSTDFEITAGEKETRGTDIILHVNEDSLDYLESGKVGGILNKYCKFLPIEIEFEEKVINTTAPIWVKNPTDLKDEDYLEFYKTLYPFSEEPLFWIHLNVDYPFNLTGILYFPKVKNDLTLHRDKIQLYSRQVFITDEVKEIVPEFLTLMHGVIDSPDIPLNVSRSYLQSDSSVKKINSYITKKVADKLSDLFKSDRESFEQKWESIGLFVKYGMVTDEKFYDRSKKFGLLKNLEGKFYTFEEYGKHVEAAQTDKNGNKVFLYTNDQELHHSYIVAAQKKGYDILILDGPLDSHFISTLEQKLEKTSLKRVDADVAEKLIEKDEAIESVLSKEEEEKVVEIFKKAIAKENVAPEVTAMSADAMPVVITQPEFMRRMQEMQQMQGNMMFGGDMPGMQAVTINGNHPLIGKIVKAENEEEQISVAKQAYDLALLSQNMLKGESLTTFIERSISMIADEK